MTCPDGLAMGFGLPTQLCGAICYLRSDFGRNDIGLSRYSEASGLLIATTAQASYVLTAAHVLYRSDLGRLADSVGVWLGCIGASAAATRGSTSYLIPDGFETSGDAPSLDFAAVRVTRVDPTVIAPLGLATSSDLAAKQVSVVGYPAEDACAGTRRPYHVAASAQPNGAGYSYDEPTYDGMSGSALIGRSTSGDALHSYGVHIRRSGDPSGVQAVRFSDSVLGQLEQWIP